MRKDIWGESFASHQKAKVSKVNFFRSTWKLTVIMLVFLFLINPLAPALAQVSTGDDAIIPDMTTVESASPSTPVNVTNPDNGNDNSDSSDTVPADTTMDQSTPTDQTTVPPLSSDIINQEDQSGQKLSNSKVTLQPQTLSAGSLVSVLEDPKADHPVLPGVDTSGALTESYPIVVPPGRNGLQPDIRLEYNSANTENANWIGYGWDINIPYIQRVNKRGSENIYTSPVYFMSSLSGELATTSDGTVYVSRVENGDFYKYTFSSNAWTVTDKNGTVYKFGTSAASRQDDPGNSSHIYKWELDEIRDTNDNYIKYTYYKDSGQIYPDTIVYTGNGSTDGIFTVSLSRESRSDNAPSYKTAFGVTPNYRINQIEVNVNGTWVKKYSLAYTTGDNGLRSLLSSVTEQGQDESNNTITLPATTFTYQRPTNGWTLDTGWSAAPVAFSGNITFTDVNGDGLSDIVYGVTNSNGTYSRVTYLNTGNKSWASTSNYVPPASFYYSGSIVPDQGVRMADLNGDGLSDIIQSGYNVGGGWINSATSTSWVNDDNWWPSLQFSDINTSDPGTRILDLNGDGLPDLVNKISDTTTYINNGRGWISSSAWNLPLSTRAENYIRLVDVNGDGLPDMLYASRYQNVDTKKVYLNKGDGSWNLYSTTSLPTIFSTGDGIYPDSGDVIMDANGDGLADIIESGITSSGNWLGTGKGWATSTWDTSVQFVDSVYYDSCVRVTDVNGDGLPDLVKAKGNGLGGIDTSVYINNGKRADLLVGISHSQGGSSTVSYKSTPAYKDGSNNLYNPKLPISIDTVYQLATYDGIATSTTTYLYKGAIEFYKNALDRKLAGFAEIDKTDPAGNVTKTYYHTGNGTDSSHGEYSDNYWKIGKPYRTEQYDGSSNLYAKSINKWDDYDLGNISHFVKLAQTVNSSYDGGGTHKDKAETYSYDNSNGNLTEKDEYGQVTGSDDGTFTDTGNDKFTTSLSYATGGGYGVTGLLQNVTVTDQSSNKVKEDRYYYDSQSLGSVTKGNLTKHEQWKSGSTYINTQNTYDGTYGLVTQTTDPREKNTSYSYDSYHLYPTTVTNPLSQTRQYTYDYSLGQAKQTTDPNGNIFQTVYDGLDRVTALKQPDFTSTSTMVTQKSFAYSDIGFGSSVQETDNLTSATSTNIYTYMDGLARPIQTRKQAEGSNYEVADKVYNTIGLLQKESLPYFSSGTSRTTATSTSALFTTYTYDPMQRVTSAVNAVGTTSNTYTPWKVTITDPRSKIKDLCKDAYDNLIQVDEHDASSTYSTYYTYDYLKDLTSITDAVNNVRNFTYDGLGRRLTAQDLHASGDSTYGSWSYTYDDAGNQTSVVDPKSQTINYTYDDINRPLAEDYTGQAGTEKTYTYDTCANGKGQLCSASSSVISIVNTYDVLGNITTSTSTIGSTAYPTSYTYDQLGDILTITNPDGMQIKYEYSSAGILDKVYKKEITDGSFVTLVSNIDYAPIEKPTTIAYANGITTTNTYDASNLYRLSNKVSRIGTSSPQSLAYTYDADNNITQIADTSNTHSAKTVTYGYDDLNRLTSATATGTPTGISGYSQTYSYNAIGNMTSKSDIGNYNYSSSGYANPHALTSVTVGTSTTATLSYDNNGNLLTDGTRTNTWNYLNQLTQTVKNNATTTYAYDFGGQRIKYSTATSTIVYPTKFYNTDGTTPVKHIFAGNELIATITGTGASSTIQYIHTDHLGGSSIATDASGNVVETTDYLPYGGIRLDEKTGSFNEQRKFTGYEYDTDTDLNYANARYYNSNFGNFISQDPMFVNTDLDLSDPQSLNSYSYSRDNPLIYTDPTGMYYLVTFAMPKSGWSYGDVMGSFNGVTVHYNGIGSAAIQYSCVSFAKSYSKTAFGMNINVSVGDANGMWSKRSTINQSLTNSGSAYTFKENKNKESSSLPGEGDLLFSPSMSSYGHVMVVMDSSFDSDSGTGSVTVVDQNANKVIPHTYSIKQGENGYEVYDPNNSNTTFSGWWSPVDSNGNHAPSPFPGNLRVDLPKTESQYAKLWNDVKSVFSGKKSK